MVTAVAVVALLGSTFIGTVGAHAASANPLFTAVPAVPAPPTPDDAFYIPPSPLPDGKPGDVIRSRSVATTLYLARVTQLMYLSTSNQGERVAVTGVLYTPLNQKPGTSNPLVVHTPGTRGVGHHCAPSKQANLQNANPASGDYSSTEYGQFLEKGISVVVTDYQGQGTPGLSPYLVGRPEGYNGLDALRAVQRLKGSGVSAESPVGISGYSQGGQAAGWAAELQPAYAPELNLKGALVGGAVTDMNGLVDHVNGNVTAGTGFGLAAALIGLPFAFPELQDEVDKRLTAEGKQAIKRLANSCYMEYFLGFGTTTTADLTEPDVLTDTQWRRRFAESKLGTKAPRAPAYIYHGKADTVVPFDMGAGLYRDWCALGASATFEAIPGLEHIGGIWLGPPNGIRWLADRLAGGEAPSGCHEVAPG